MIWGSPKIRGTLFGVLAIGIIIYLGLYWGGWNQGLLGKGEGNSSKEKLSFSQNVLRTGRLCNRIAVKSDNFFQLGITWEIPAQTLSPPMVLGKWSLRPN